MLRWIAVSAACLLLSANASMGQALGPHLLSVTLLARDLPFPAAPTAIPDVASMGIFTPEGPGPFPAVILHHQCSGLNRSMLDWAREAVKRGYVAFLVDSLGPRGVDSVCLSAKGDVRFSRGVRDALQAAQHLRKFDFVDKNRIAHVGFSWGAMVSLMTSSRSYSAGVGGGGAIRAFVSFYPGCYTVRPANAPAFEILYSDVNRPLLVLLGGKDAETPASDCISRLQKVKSGGAPVEWHVFPDAAHCWDCLQWNGLSKVDFKGVRVTYVYDAEVTAESGNRAFEFLERNMKH